MPALDKHYSLICSKRLLWDAHDKELIKSAFALEEPKHVALVTGIEQGNCFFCPWTSTTTSKHTEMLLHYACSHLNMMVEQCSVENQFVLIVNDSFVT
jgi:hypothetical protein